MKTTIWISIAAAALALAASAVAQTEPEGTQQVRPVQWVRISPLDNPLSVIPTPADMAPISGKPYCATARTVQYSPDGVHVDQSDSNRVCRDEQGRTRREAGAGRTVVIADPVSGVTYALQTETRTALKRSGPSRPALQPANADPINFRMVNQTARTMFETAARLGGLNVIWDPETNWPGGQFTIDLKNAKLEEALNALAVTTRTYWRPIGPNTIFVTDDPTKSAPAQMSLVEAAREQATRAMAGARARAREQGGAAAPNVIVDDLGSQVVNGVIAKGVRTTSVIPTGAVGNDHEIKTATERWVSDDLHALVRSVYTDSRAGSTVYDLINIIQAPPDPSLFQVPAGYTVQEGGGARGGRGGGSPATPVPGGRGGRGGPMPVPPAGGR